MAELRPDYLYSTSTLHEGRFQFNQVRYEQHHDQPSRVVLVGWDHNQGAFVWTVAGDVIPRRAGRQAPGYSRGLKNIDPDHPPAWLGEPHVISRADMEEAGAWCAIDGLAPHPKRRAILDAVGRCSRICSQMPHSQAPRAMTWSNGVLSAL